MDLKDRQENLHNKIKQKAENCNLVRDDYYPIYDGAFYPDLYSCETNKVLWILYEPYDTVKDDMPSGGDKSLNWWFEGDDGFHNKPKKMSRTYVRMVYSLYGIYYNCEYNEMPWFYEIVERGNKCHKNTLEKAALINLSKMPAWSTSSYSNVVNAYESYWKEIIQEQLDVYNPDIIIAGGKPAFAVLQELMLSNSCNGKGESQDLRLITKYDFQSYPNRLRVLGESDFVDNYNSLVNGYISTNGKIVLASYHPSYCGMKGLSHEAYADGISRTVFKLQNILVNKSFPVI